MEWVKVLADYGLSGVLVICIIYLVKIINEKGPQNGKSEKIFNQNIEIDKKIDKLETCIEYLSKDLQILTGEIRQYLKETNNLNISINALVNLIRGKNE